MASHHRPPALRTVVLAACVIAVSLVGCGGGAVEHQASASAAVSAGGMAPVQAPPPATVPTAPVPLAAPTPRCAASVASILGRVGRRIAAQAVGGRNVVAAQRRLARSAALAAAVLHGDRAATRAALHPLLRQQIRRIVVWRGRHLLVALGSAPALAPVAGQVVDPAGRPVGHYLLSVADDAAIAGITHSTTGAQVVMRAGGRTVATTLTSPVGALPASGALHEHGIAYRVVGFGARAFPSGAMRISMLVPATELTTCGATPPQTRAATFGAIAQRLYRTEASGTQVARVLRHVALDRGFELAVAHDDAAALRTAIVRFFRQRSLHVVRIRATTADGRLINDVGGPFVIAPASADVPGPGGTGVIGRVTLSVQDDTGYIKLLHRFTGAEVLLSTPVGIVPGSTRLRPSSVPDAGTATVGRRTYQASSFAARAFPDGPLRVSLLVR